MCGEQKRLEWVDAFKGIGICGIVMIHSGAATLPSVIGKIGNVGKNGVQLFFLISAYLSYVSMERRFRERKMINIKSALKWYVEKIIRLMPLYYFALALYGIFGGGSTYWLGSEERITFMNVITHLLFLHGLFPHYVNSIIGVEWYLGVLALFYLCIPFIYKYINSLEKSIVLLGISMLCYYTMRVCIPRILSLDEISDRYIYDNYMGTFCFFTQFPVLVLGIVWYYIHSAVKKYGKENKLLSYEILGIGVLLLVGLVYKTNKILGLHEPVIFAICFCFIIISQLIGRCPLINNKFFRILGKYSYPIYLFHFKLIDFWARYLTISNKIVAWGIKYAVILASSLCLAFILTHIYDTPVTNWIKKKILGKEHVV